MTYFLSFCAVFCILLSAETIAARKAPDRQWTVETEEQPMGEAIKPVERESFAKDFDPNRPQFPLIYYSKKDSQSHDIIETDKSFVKDFDPNRPQFLLIYY
ncbi:hypothetical protein HRI_004357000 [Hibiscus trionum]|uniref:Uncharacterized protein n=1 Tax=Hibiscus trionum TaxID=183268 RepID=A0A9W7MJG0_HIBTR|nr:hypothetical protein HRI_004357000 [Hibiscus trionum]